MYIKPFAVEKWMNAYETGAFVTPGDCFEQPQSMRIGYACDKPSLMDGLAALSEFAKTL